MDRGPARRHDRSVAWVPWLLFAGALALRAFGCAAASVPGWDGISYLWIAGECAHGRFEALYATVFHPLYPLLVAPGLAVAPEVEPQRIGQITAALPAALAVVPLWHATRTLFCARTALWSGVLYTIGTWFVRHPAECMSEGPFYLLVASWLLALLEPRRRSATAGAFAGLAFLTRPEGGALALVGAVHLWCAGARRQAVRHAAVAAAIGLLYPLGALAAGEGFVLTPKAAFNWDVGAGGAGNPLVYYAVELARLPGIAFEGLGYAVTPLALAGVLLLRPRRAADPRWLLLVPFLLQCLVVPLLRSHYRFVSGFGLLLLPHAGHALVALRGALARRARWLPLLATIAVFGAEAKLYLATPPDRSIERDLGRALGAELSPGQTLVSDMARVDYYAGLPPPPPRRLEPDALLRAAAEPHCRFVALRRGRTALAPDALAAIGFHEVSLPTAVATHPHRDEVALFTR